MSKPTLYRSKIVLSEPLRRSINCLDAHPYTVAHMRFNRRSERAIELTDALEQQIEEDGLQLDEPGFIRSDYMVRSDEEAFRIFQNHDTQLNERDPMTEQEMLDCILIISLRELEVEVDFETFCNLRIHTPGDFDSYGYDDDVYDSDDDKVNYDIPWDNPIVERNLQKLYQQIMRIVAAEKGGAF